METQKLQLNGTEEIKSGNRSQVYALLARSFRFPAEVESGESDGPRATKHFKALTSGCSKSA